MKRSSAVPAVFAILLCAACGDQESPVGPSLARANGSHAESAAVEANRGGPSPSSARAALAVPFKGTFQGPQTVTPLAPPFASAEVSAIGTGARVGRFTMELPHTVNLATSSATGTCTIVAANGDVLTGQFTGQAQVGPVVSIVEHVTITGGTGRFEGASGSFVITRTYNPAAGVTIGSFEGTISAPGAAR